MTYHKGFYFRHNKFKKIKKNQKKKKNKKKKKKKKKKESKKEMTRSSSRKVRPVGTTSDTATAFGSPRGMLDQTPRRTATEGIMGSLMTHAALLKMRTPFFATLRSAFLVTVLAPGIAAGLIVAIPIAREPTPGFSWENQGFAFGWSIVMLIGSVFVGITAPYIYGNPARQRWPHISWGIISVYIATVQVSLMVIPQAVGRFPLWFIAPPASAALWTMAYALILGRYARAIARGEVSYLESRIGEGGGSTALDADLHGAGGDDESTDCGSPDARELERLTEAENDDDASRWRPGSAAGEKKKMKEKLTEVTQPLPLPLPPALLAPPTVMRMWLTMMAAIVTLGSYYFMCCSFFLAFANVNESTGAQLSVGIVFVLINWIFRSIMLRMILVRGGSTVNWTALHILSFWFEVMGEVFVGLAISRSQELYFFGTMLTLESALFALSTGLAVRRVSIQVGAGEFGRAESTVHGIFLHIIAELAATLTFTMTLAAMAFSPASHAFPFQELSVADFQRTVGVVMISFGIHLCIYVFAHFILRVRTGISSLAVGAQPLNHRLTLMLLAAQAASVPTLLFSILARDFGVGYDLLKQ
jgi:hypothetical protein